MFVPLSHRPGHAQVDFGEADGYVGGKKIRYHYFCLDLPHSDAIFVKAYPAELTEAFLDGHVAAFDFMGGVPQSILYDNMKIAVAQILGDGQRKRTQAFTELQSHYLFEDKFGRPAKGNDKGKVEGLVGYSRRHFMVPLIIAADFDELNAKLLDGCIKRQQARLRGKTETIAERLVRDRQALMPLPTAPFDPCHKVATRVSSLSLVRYRTNDDCVPTQYGHREVLVKGYVDRVEICSSGETIAVHRRSYAREDFIYDPLHYAGADRDETACPGSGGTTSELGPACRVRPLTTIAGGAHGPAWSQGVHPGLAASGSLQRGAGRARHQTGDGLGCHQLRCDQASHLVQPGTAARQAGSDAVSVFTASPCGHDPGTHLSATAGRCGMSADAGSSAAMSGTTTSTSVAPQVLLTNHFKALKLPTFAREYEKVGAECARDGVDYPRYLLRLCELERIDRERRNVERRIRLAKFPVTKSFDTFDFAAVPGLNKSLVMELARSEWITQRENVIALGPSGVGKTHVALGLGLAACQKGFSVSFTTAAALVHELMEARDEKRLRILQKQLAHVKLLIVDELGYVPFSAVGAELLFEVFSRRYENGATLLTSNLPFDEWTSVLGSERLTGALLDRLTHHVHILEMNGESYRLAASKQRQRKTSDADRADSKGAATT